MNFIMNPRQLPSVSLFRCSGIQSKIVAKQSRQLYEVILKSHPVSMKLKFYFYGSIEMIFLSFWKLSFVSLL